MAGRGVGGFFPSARPVLLEPQMLQKGKAQHGERGMMREATPLPAFKVIESELLLEVLMRLLAHPAPPNRVGRTAIVDGHMSHLDRHTRCIARRREGPVRRDKLIELSGLRLVLRLYLSERSRLGPTALHWHLHLREKHAGGLER